MVVNSNLSFLYCTIVLKQQKANSLDVGKLMWKHYLPLPLLPPPPFFFTPFIFPIFHDLKFVSLSSLSVHHNQTAEGAAARVREVVVGTHTPRGAQACQLSSPTSGASRWAHSLPPPLLLSPSPSHPRQTAVASFHSTSPSSQGAKLWTWLHSAAHLMAMQACTPPCHPSVRPPLTSTSSMCPAPWPARSQTMERPRPNPRPRSLSSTSKVRITVWGIFLSFNEVHMYCGSVMLIALMYLLLLLEKNTVNPSKVLQLCISEILF